MHKTWLRKSAAHPNRGLTADGTPVPEGERKSATQKYTQLDMMLNYVAGYASVVSQNMVVIKSTCFNEIWQHLRQYYLFVSSGAQFFDLASIKWLPDECHECLYQRIAAFCDDNLLTAGCGITHHGVAVTEDEEITPIVENTIAVMWLQLIHPGLPGLVKEKYGSEL